MNLIFNAPSAELPATGFAALTTRNGHFLLAFDDSVDESAIWRAVAVGYDGAGNVTVEVHFCLASATTGNVVIQAAIERIGAVQDIDTDGFAAAKSNTVAVPATSGVFGSTAFTFTNAEADALGAGEQFRLKITRDADNAADTATGDLQVALVEVSA